MWNPFISQVVTSAFPHHLHLLPQLYDMKKEQSGAILLSVSFYTEVPSTRNSADLTLREFGL